MTRPDLDGLTCAVILSQVETIDSVELVHPQDVTDRRVTIGATDIIANLPYHPACGMWFDNHLLTDPKAMPPTGFKGRYGKAPSAARLVYEHYLSAKPDLARHERLVSETDRLDSAQLGISDVTAPAGYILIGLTLDPRTGLGSAREYFDLLLPAVRDRAIEDVLALPEVQKRAALMREQDQAFREAALAHSRVAANVVVTDFRPLDPIPVGNRFLIFTLFPQANVAVRVQWGPGREKVAVSAGRSIFNRTSRANVGVLMSLYGGGGHAGAGACLLAAASADPQIAEIVSTLQRNA
ncbi:MAG TPA: exopolyphosphatase [Vicinamibacteria bacterium]|nr:exopolyphosphatase [Vicinamibacteria bacterium]